MLAQPQTFDILIAVGASAIGFSSAANYAAQQRPVLALIVTIGTIGILVVTTVKHVLGLAEARKKESIHELEGCLHTLHAVLDAAACAPPVTLRLAIHVPAGETLQQVTEYIGVPPKKGRRGRRFPVNAGIIGKAFREKELLIARRVNDDYQLYLQELRQDWSYTDDQAKLLNPGVMAWMAVPFVDPDTSKVAAVLYIDATSRDFLTDARQELVVRAVNGIAVFVGKRYP